MKTTLTPSLQPTEEQIQHAAYLLWLENGRPENRDLDHWLAAKEFLTPHDTAIANPPRRRARSTAKGRATPTA
jgi:hypothetical protein